MHSFQLNSNTISHCDSNGMLPSQCLVVYFYTSVLETESPVFPKLLFPVALPYQNHLRKPLKLNCYGLKRSDK